jgi:hypothetical protein
MVARLNCLITIKTTSIACTSVPQWLAAFQSSFFSTALQYSFSGILPERATAQKEIPVINFTLYIRPGVQGQYVYRYKI